MLLLLAPAAILTPQSAVSGQPARHDACRYGNWSRPHWLETPMSLPAATRFHTATMTRATQPLTDTGPEDPRVGYAVGVAGFTSVRFPRKSSLPTQWPPQLRAIRLDGAQFKRVAGDFWYAHPRAATDDAGTLHVVWGEPDESLPGDPKTLHGELPTIRSVWYARLRAGIWSRAERIYRGQELYWDEFTTSRLIVDDQDGLHVAFAAADSFGRQIVNLSAIRAPTRRWRATVTRRRIGMAFLDLAVGPDRRLAIVLVSGVAFPRPRPNVLFLTQSRDGGGTWTPDTAITTPADDPAIEPHVFFDRNAALRVEWVKQPDGTFVGGTLWHTTLDGANRGAASALALPSDEITSGSKAAIDSCGTIHVFTQAYGSGEAVLWYTRLTTDGWSPWRRPFDVLGAHASIAQGGRFVHVVWNVGSPLADSVPLSGLAHSTLPILGRADDRRRRH